MKMNEDQTHLEEVQFEDMELLSEDPGETIADFNYGFYSHRQRALRLRYLGLLLIICGAAATAWFIWIPALDAHAHSWEFYHSASFFFLLCWGILVLIILGYFFFPQSGTRKPYRTLIDESADLTRRMIELHHSEQNISPANDNG
jgi:TRAP-type mannitol/chloroaromatic compound transport system permease small subunit